MTGDAVSSGELVTGDDLDWRRPHPLTIVVEIGSALRPILLALVLLGSNVVEAGAVVELAVILGPLGAALGRWYTTRYALDDEALHHQYGLLWRQRQVLPRSNIQNVSTTAGVVARLGSVVELNVSDASSNGDIRLRFVSQAEADHLTTLLRSDLSAATAPGPGPGPTPLVQGEPVTADVATAPAPTADPELDQHREDQHREDQHRSWPAPVPQGQPVEIPALVRPSLGDLVRIEATSIPPVTSAVAALLAAIIGATALGSGLIEFASLDTATAWVILAGAVVALLGTTVIQIGGRVLELGGYQLTAEPDRLRIRAGLLTEARITARRERIQQLKVERHLTHRKLGLERVAFETADVDNRSSAGTGYLSPTGPAGSWRDLAIEAFGQLSLDESDLVPVSPLTRRRTLVRYGLAASPLVALWLVHPVVGVAVPLAVLASGWWYSRRRFQELGWALTDDQFLVRGGVVIGSLNLVNVDKVQILRTTSTFFQRRLGLATFHLSTAGRGFSGGRVSLPDVTSQTAEELTRRIGERASLTPIARTL